jgi:arylsulfatase A-like enzyme
VARLTPRPVRRDLALVAGGAGLVAASLALLRSVVSTPQERSAGALDAAPPAVASAERAADAEIAAAPSTPRDAGPARKRSYNVLLITVDTLRADLGFSGYPRPVSPNIDALAERSAVFERAYSLASYTAKSLGPMLIGRYMSETWRDADHFVTFAPENVFVAERAQAMGFRTLAGMSHIGFKWPTGFQQGFDLWNTSAIPEGQEVSDDSVTSARLSDVALELLSRPENATPKWSMDETSSGAAREEEPRRFFAWFHYVDPHLLYVAHKGAPPFATMPGPSPRRRDLYDEEVWFTDRQIGRVLDYVATQPWAADTAIILTSDHGECFGEHGMTGHGRELWEPLVRIPLLVYVPGAPARRISVKRSGIDLAPTIVELLGMDASPDESPYSLRGTSLLRDVLSPPGAALAERDVHIDMPEGPFNDARRAIITGPSPGKKLIVSREARYALYDLAADPNEEHDLSGDKEALAAAIDAYKNWRKGLREVPPTPVKSAGLPRLKF